MIAGSFNSFRACQDLFNTADDADMREMSKEEMKELDASLESIEKELVLLLLPRNKDDDKNVMVEIRAGTGGGEANLWAGDLTNAYTKVGPGVCYHCLDLLSTHLSANIAKKRNQKLKYNFIVWS